MKYAFSLCCLLSVACTGVLDGQTHSDQSAASPSPNLPATAAAGGSSSTSVPVTSDATPASPPFKVRNTEPELVPFEMRVRRIANALGVQVDHQMFAIMAKNRLKLGAYDYANGALPDSSWNANRIAAWIDALKPVCNSSEMKAMYPALPADLPKLVRAAWGHLPSDQDTADFRDAVAASGVSDTVAYETTCMAVFTAAEFVYR